MKRFSFVVALIGTFFLFSCGSSTTDNNTTDETDQLVEASIEVAGNCGMCKDRIEETAKGIEGVKTAVWDKETKQLKITYINSLDIHKVHQAIADAGHDTEMHKANDEVYNNLPGCCQYREGNPHDDEEKQ